MLPLLDCSYIIPAHKIDCVPSSRATPQRVVVVRQVSGRTMTYDRHMSYEQLCERRTVTPTIFGVGAFVLFSCIHICLRSAKLVLLQYTDAHEQ